MVTILILLSGAVFLVELMNVDLTKLIPLANLGCGILGTMVRSPLLEKAFSE